MAKSISFSVGADNSDFVNTMKRTQAIGNNAAKRINAGIGSGLKGIGASLAGLAAGFVTVNAAVSSFSAALDTGGRLNDLAAKVGATAGQLSIMERAFENAGIGAEKVSPAFAKMNRLIADADGGAKAAQERLQALGLTSSDLLGKLPTEQMGMLADSIAKIEDPTLRSSAAMDVFGKSGADMLPLLRNFSGELDTAKRQLGSWPDILDKANVDMDALGDNFAAVQKKGMEFAGGILSVVAPALAKLSEALAEIDAAGAGKNVAETFTNQGAGKLQVGVKEGIGNWLLGLGDSIDDSMGGPMGDIALNATRALAGAFKKDGALLRKDFKLEVPIEPVFNGPLEKATLDLPLAGVKFAMSLKEGADYLADTAATVARATRPGALNFDVPVPRVNAIPPVLRPQSDVAAFNALQSSTSQFEKLQRSIMGEGTMLGPSRALIGASLDPSTGAALGGSRSGYEGSYGLIRRGDTSRKAREAREQAEREKSKTAEGTNERLDKLNRTIETVWGTS